MNAIIAGIYISACITVAFGCLYMTASRSRVPKHRHPLTIVILTGVAFLLLWQAGKMLFPNQPVATLTRLALGISTVAKPSWYWVTATCG